MPQTKWQYQYGIRRTWANKTERMAQAIRVGDWDLHRRLDNQTQAWAERKIKEMGGA